MCVWDEGFVSILLTCTRSEVIPKAGRSRRSKDPIMYSYTRQTVSHLQLRRPNIPSSCLKSQKVTRGRKLPVTAMNLDLLTRALDSRLVVSRSVLRLGGAWRGARRK